MSSYDANRRTERLVASNHREGHCFLFTQELIKHALLHIIWGEPIFSCQTSAINSHALSAFLGDMTCNRLGPHNLLLRQIESLINAGMVHDSG